MGGACAMMATHTSTAQQPSQRVPRSGTLLLQSLAPVAVLELAHRKFDCTLKVMPIGGVTQLSCETEA